MRHNPTQVRVDDYSKVGALLGALLTTTVFLKRAPLVTNLAGGAGLSLFPLSVSIEGLAADVLVSDAALGIAGGVITHTVKMVQEEGAKKAGKEVKEALPDPKELGKGIAKGT